jgi:hypothetical protein
MPPRRNWKKPAEKLKLNKDLLQWDGGMVRHPDFSLEFEVNDLFSQRFIP